MLQYTILIVLKFSFSISVFTLREFLLMRLIAIMLISEDNALLPVWEWKCSLGRFLKIKH